MRTSPSPTVPDTAVRRPYAVARRDLWWLAGVAVVVLLYLLQKFLIHGIGLPVGPDAPVYLWWMRVGGAEGLSVIGDRPGSTALLLTFAGTLHLSAPATVAGTECALGVVVALGAAAFARIGGSDRASWLLAAILAGTFAVHLVAGYVANIAFAATFLAAGVALAAGSRRGTVAAIGLLGGGGIAHPEFFLLGGLILLTASVWAMIRGERAEAARGLVAVAGGGVIVAAGVLSMLAGPSRLRVDTSQDAFFRRAGLSSALHHEYLDRFIHRWTRYVQWVSVPLAVLGVTRIDGPRRRFLGAWLLVVVIGIPVALATGWFPADRLITFGYAVPILAAFGVVWVFKRLRANRALALAAASTLVVAMVAGSFLAWRREKTYLTERELAAAGVAAGIAARTPSGTPLVFVVDDRVPSATFLATRAANVIRAAMPPGRAADVHVYVGTPANYLAGLPTVGGNTEFDTLSRVYLNDIRSAGGSPIAFVLTPFYLNAAPVPPAFRRVTDDVYGTTTDASAGPIVDPLGPSSPAAIALATVAILTLLWVVGLGWARASLPDAFAAVALAPAFGVAALVAFAVAGERLGLQLSGALGPTLVSVLAGGSGYVVREILERGTGPESPAKVGE